MGDVVGHYAAASFGIVLGALCAVAAMVGAIYFAKKGVVDYKAWLKTIPPPEPIRRGRGDRILAAVAISIGVILIALAYFVPKIRGY